VMKVDGGADTSHTFPAGTLLPEVSRFY
jgi:hypothetical protein